MVAFSPKICGDAEAFYNFIVILLHFPITVHCKQAGRCHSTTNIQRRFIDNKWVGYCKNWVVFRKTITHPRAVRIIFSDYETANNRAATGTVFDRRRQRFWPYSLVRRPDERANVRVNNFSNGLFFECFIVKKIRVRRLRAPRLGWVEQVCCLR